MGTDGKTVQELYSMLTPHKKKAMKAEFCLTFNLSYSSWKKRYHHMQGMAFTEEERLWAQAFVSKQFEKTLAAA